MSNDSASLLLSCSCVVWETWTWTTGEKTPSTRAATAQTTLLSSGSGRYRSFTKPTRFIFLSYNFFLFHISLSVYASIDCAVDGCRKANSTLAVCDWDISSPDERLCRTLRWDSSFVIYGDFSSLLHHIFPLLSAACSCEFTRILLRASHHTIIFYVFDGCFFFQGLTDHSCSPLSNGEHVINSPEPTHGKHLPEIVLVITQCYLVLKLCVLVCW